MSSRFNQFGSIKKITLGVVSCVLTLFLIEILLRITNYQRKYSVWIWQGEERNSASLHYWDLSDSRIYAALPNVDMGEIFHSDAFGFRYSSHSGQLRDTTQKQNVIISVGDSFTFGHNVKPDDAYPAQLERLLRKSGLNVLVHNAGVLGYGADQEYSYIIDELIPGFHPDLIVWNVNINDIYDSNASCLYKESENGFLKLPGRFNSLYIQGYVFRHIPKKIYDTRLFDVILHILTLITHQQIFTVGCTQPAGNPDTVLFDAFSQKFRFFAYEMKRQYPNQKILFTLTPFKSNLTNDTAQTADTILSMKSAVSILELFRSLPYPWKDANALMKEYINRLNTQEGNGKASEMNPMSLFITDKEFPLNAAHLNEEGNAVWAASMVDAVSTYLRADDVVNR